MSDIINYSAGDLKKMLPFFAPDIHKGNRGGVLICGGSANYRGAPLLAGLAALRAGAGYVVLAIPDFMIDAASVFLPEVILAPVTTRNDTMLLHSLKSAVENYKGKCGAAVFGPGIGRAEAMGKITDWFVSGWGKQLVLDADALFFVAKNNLKPLSNTVITPHTGEAAGLLRTETANVSEDRLNAVKKLASVAEITLLKGRGTLTSNGTEIRRIDEGSAALSIPGSGDVLSGIIAAFAVQGMDLFDAATAGALAHAMAGKMLEEKFGLRGALARDIANIIPDVLR